MQGRYKASLSIDLAHSLEFGGFYTASEARFLEVFYQSFTGPNPEFSLNFARFWHCSKYRRSSCDIILVGYCTCNNLATTVAIFVFKFGNSCFLRKSMLVCLNNWPATFYRTTTFFLIYNYRQGMIKFTYSICMEDSPCKVDIVELVEPLWNWERISSLSLKFNCFHAPSMLEIAT